MDTRKNPPTATATSSPWTPPQTVLDLTAAWERKRQAKRDRYGKRHFVPALPYQTWLREYGQHRHVGVMLLRQYKALSKAQFAVLCLLHEQQPSPGGRRLTPTEIGAGICLSRSSASRIVAVLAQCGFVVNIGSPHEPNLAVNPIIGYWNVPQLRKLRKPNKSFSK
jgi:hypothetical protein